MAACGAKDQIKSSDGNALNLWKEFHNDGWQFGFLSYDLKNYLEINRKTGKALLHSKNRDGIGMPELHFFKPEILIAVKQLKTGEFELTCQENGIDQQHILDEIEAIDIPNISFTPRDLTLKKRIEKSEYIQKVEAIKQHIIEGDVYELNFCQEFYIEDFDYPAATIYRVLNERQRAPFSSFYKLNDKYLICTSPERFLKRTGNRIISQPMKGTIARGKDDISDKQMIDTLRNSKKDQAENIMIVDLVRNDLAKSCKPGTVKVDELFGIYPFEGVHQMISTVSGTLKDKITPAEIILDAFPMGSMTGAPKVKAMELIEQYESVRRGLFSGSVGYIAPGGDFNFNVVIRSILLNTRNNYLSLQTGGAIVYDSDAEMEYEESLLKASTILRALGIEQAAEKQETAPLI